MNPLKFAVVREDVHTEVALIQHFGVRQALLVCSGGCTVLSLKAMFNDLRLTVFDANPTQLAHLRAKADAANRGDSKALNVAHDNPDALNQCGAFEGLFRLLRAGIGHLVSTEREIAAYFDPSTSASERLERAQTWVESPYWLPVFHSTFHDQLLNAMFGPAATQHAVHGSYPAYFADVIARGLKDPSGFENPFLQHILLGYYREDSAPIYVHGTSLDGVETVLGGLLEVPDVEKFDLIQLSNIFDWSDDSLVESWAQHLRRMKPGAVILIRQLNNTRDLRRFFEPDFAFDGSLGEHLQQEDRSLFYNRIEVGVRV